MENSKTRGTGSLEKGKLLIEGNGKYNILSLLYWAFWIIGDVALFLVGLYIRDIVASAPRNAIGVDVIFLGRIPLDEANSVGAIIIAIGVVGIIVGTIFATLALRRSQSEIRVYENCITGKNIQGLSPTVQAFSVPIADVMNVDVLKKTGIIIRTQYGTYTSYTKKADEIREIIMDNME